jgi:putative membrane protein
MTSANDPGAAVPPAADPAAGAAPSTPPAVAAARHHRVHRTRASGLWVGMALAAIVLLLLLVFILENGQQANIGYFGAHGRLPLGVALLLAAVAGALLVTIPGSARIMQLRRTARRHRAVDVAAAQAGTGTAQASAGTAQTSTAPDSAVPAASPQQPGNPA